MGPLAAKTFLTHLAGNPMVSASTRNQTFNVVVFKVPRNETCGLTARLLYGSGRRLMECLPLRIEEVDFTRRTLFVRRGKGCQDWTPILAQW